METLETEIRKLKEKVDKIYSAIVGNEITQDGGIAKRLITVEKEVEINKTFRQRMLWTIGLASLGFGVFSFIVQILLSWLVNK